uniref:Uncharacterized protein LOC102805188 n=1 Tax=Saccoglossus kowalevskii TaxID=10224 RepID=A0ABM0N0C3_SACKO
MGSSASSEQLNKSPSRNGKTPQPASARTTESRRRNRGFEEVEFQHNGQQLQVQDDIIFETFTHQNGRDYPCIVQQGQRFYLDSWETQEWQPFPREWYNKGKLEREGKIEDESVSPPNQYNDQPSTSSRVVDRDIDAIDVSGGFNTQQDDREGILNHP